MKKRVLQIVNSFLSIFSVRLGRLSEGYFSMLSAVQRAKQKFPINCIIDIGAARGKWSAEVMKIFPGVKILAIEPLHEQRLQLEQIKNKNKNFDFCICAAGRAENEKVNLNVTKDLDGSTITDFGGNIRPVQVRRLDNIVAEKGLTGPFLIKFDTHGYEIPILEGAENVLQQTSAIIMEVYNFKITSSSLRFPQMCAYLEDKGFRCYDIAEPMLRKHDNSFWQMDLFFCRKDAELFSYSEYL